MDKKTIELIEMLKDQMDTLLRMEKLSNQRIDLMKESIAGLVTIFETQQEEIKELKKNGGHVLIHLFPNRKASSKLTDTS